MRQKDKEFVSILNKISTSSQIENHIKFLNKHCYKPPPKYQTFSYIFHSNKDVQKQSNKMMYIVQSKEFMLVAHDKKISSIEKHTFDHKEMHFPSAVVLKYAC